MRITESQLRKIVREEIAQAQYFVVFPWDYEVFGGLDDEYRIVAGPFSNVRDAWIDIKQYEYEERKIALVVQKIGYDARFGDEYMRVDLAGDHIKPLIITK